MVRGTVCIHETRTARESSAVVIYFLFIIYLFVSILGGKQYASSRRILLVESKSEFDETLIDCKVIPSIWHSQGIDRKSAGACFSLISKKILCVSVFLEILQMKKVAK